MLDRIKRILKEKRLQPSTFADRIQVSRGTVSHILNGRNNPNKDTIEKIQKAFPDISPEWLWFGEGSMYIREQFIKPDSSTLEPDLFKENEAVESPVKSRESEYPQKTEDKTPEIRQNPAVIQDFNLSTNISKKIDQIIIYFSDKTFMTFISKD